MNKIVILAVLAFSTITATGQKAKKEDKKYQSLLWKITGNGLTKPSYLFGTMHVSNKLAFNLIDSFFTAIKSVDVVALESDPSQWQEEYSKPANYSRNVSYYGASNYKSLFGMPESYFHQNSFAINKYENSIKYALAIEPAMINGMMYRTQDYTADFQEDTYLDMYIFQLGSKLGKKLTGVENFEESEKLIAEAYKDAAKEKSNKGYYDYNNYDNGEEPYTLEDAYRKGDLDHLDSVENKRLGNKAFLEKFLYKRNEIQANAIDSIIKNKQSLFVGVGSAHLPGTRGVIEMLRKMGYKLTPIKWGERNSSQKDALDKLRVPVAFNTVSSEDSTFTVAIPGKKFYSLGSTSDLNIQQYADMGNGTYYMTSRIKTNALWWGDNADAVKEKVDSLLYENIPGKILSKKIITKNGYKGFDITNRTRRGNVQRYNILITPFEVLVFKMSGIGDYVLEGDEAQKFFNSISFKEKESNQNWVSFQPTIGGFKLSVPNEPFLQKDVSNDRFEYTSYDSKENITYSLMQTTIHNYDFIEEDTFDLNLMDESFASSDIVERQISRQHGKWQGYPVLNCKYKLKDSSLSSVRYILRGPIYYAQAAYYKKETKNVLQYFDSLKMVPFTYPEVKLREDTSMKFTVQSPLFPDEKKQNDMMDVLKNMMDSYTTDEEDAMSMGFKTIGSDTAGEKIFVAYAKIPKSTYIKDTADIFKESGFNMFGHGSNNDQSYIFLAKDSGVTKDNMLYKFAQVTDTGSSRTILSKVFYKNGHVLALVALTDTMATKQSTLFANFFPTFKPMADSLNGTINTTKPSTQFFKDFASTDSAAHAKALKKFYSIDFDSSDVQSLKKIIDTISWKTKDYLGLKQSFISKLAYTKDSTLVNYFKELYIAAKDTADLQNTILNALLNMQTKASFTAFKDLIVAEPPVIIDGSSSSYDYAYADVAKSTSAFKKTNTSSYYDYAEDGGTWSSIYDTLLLAKVLFPDIMQLITLDDYKGEVMGLLESMVDSGFVDAKDYDQYFTKFYTEAKHELKKEKAIEGQKAIAKAEKENKADGEEENDYYSYRNNEDEDKNNFLLQSYGTLLIPFWDKNPGVVTFFEDLMKLKNEKIRFNTMFTLLKNKKQVPDSVINNFAEKEDYRIDLYKRLKDIKMLNKFPAKFNNQQDLIKSDIKSNSYGSNSYDTIVFIDKLPVSYDNKKGVVYFYKYKTKKKDTKWKITSYGMQPENAKEFDTENDEFVLRQYYYSYNNDVSMTLDETKPVKEQLQKILKTMLIKKHRSAYEFYNRSNSYYNDSYGSFPYVR
ncbi:TraB/GumN family protein [Ferruginibacter sp. SUN002]|uniref:TraB/GumN family protein n=1 Tax=Ferruginibacter sp. SUN002 TaxID=2937789 RepID=UPI003D35F17F